MLYKYLKTTNKHKKDQRMTLKISQTSDLFLNSVTKLLFSNLFFNVFKTSIRVDI